MADDCTQVQGAGCARLGAPPAPPPCEDTGDTGAADTAAQVQGAGPRCEGCAVGPSSAATLPLLLLLVLWLRRLPGPALVLLLLLPGLAQAVDARSARVLDGGPFALLGDATGGPAWSPRVAVSLDYVTNPVVLVTPQGSTPLLEQVLTRELSASIRLGETLRVGMMLPGHRQIVYDGELQPDQWGDIVLWFQLPVLEPSGRGTNLAFTVRSDLSTGPNELYLGSAAGVVRAVVDAEVPLGPLLMGLEGGLALAETEALPGLEWGRRSEYGGGLLAPLFGPAMLGVEAKGSLPLRLSEMTPANRPLEGLGSVVVALDGRWWLRVGAGAGLGVGLGDPGLRLAASIDLRDRPLADIDGDGVPDRRDGCRRTPEDSDGVADSDGCPESDSDSDGLLDAVDGCPEKAEVQNGWQDDDGCPDALTEVVLRVTAPGAESASVQVGEAAPVVVLTSDETRLSLPPGNPTVRVEAPGFVPWSQPLELRGQREVAVEAVLLPQRTGDVSLRLRDPDGAALAGRVWLAGAPVAVPALGYKWAANSGPGSWKVGAPGYSERTVDGDVPAGGLLTLEVELAPSPVRRLGERLVVHRALRFPLDRAEPEPADLPLLDDLAALLQAEPGLRLVRIEGHADESGDSAYNLDLSRRRARWVVAALVARGVDPGRLEALGTGEARSAAGVAVREIEVVVLIWDDGAANAP